MKTVSVSEFKARCTGLLEAVRKRKTPLLVTRRGKPIVRVVPVSTADAGRAGALAGTVLHEEDIVSPVATEDWEAAKV